MSNTQNIRFEGCSSEDRVSLCPAQGESPNGPRCTRDNTTATCLDGFLIRHVRQHTLHAHMQAHIKEPTSFKTTGQPRCSLKIRSAQLGLFLWFYIKSMTFTLQFGCRCVHLREMTGLKLTLVVCALKPVWDISISKEEVKLPLVAGDRKVH